MTQRPGQADGVLTLSAISAVVLGIIVLASMGSLGAITTTGLGAACGTNSTRPADVPARYLPIYRSAARRYDLGPRGVAVLISIHKHESGFGQNQGPSSAGAVGHMQFMPSTWAAYGVDADHDGRRDPASAADSIFAAARYLHASGAPADWYRAIYSYNHADWYVQTILETSRRYEDACEEPDTPTQLRGLARGGVARLTIAAIWMERRRIPYCWGGGHDARPGPDNVNDYCWNAAGLRIVRSDAYGLDCSGAVRWLLVLTGYPDPGPLTSGAFAAAYPSGQGRHVTIWSNAAHVFITINGRAWGTSESNYAHGPGWADHSTAGFAASHPPGL